LHLVAVVGGDHDEVSRREARAKLPGQSEAILLAKLDIDQRELGREFAGQVECLGDSSRRRADLRKASLSSTIRLRNFTP
jgi:hypothetical protein